MLLVLFGYLIFRPLFPYLEYMVRRDFIIQNLCINKNEPEKQCHGKCHLEKQLSKEVEGSDNNNLPPVPQDEKKVMSEYLVSKPADNHPLQVEVVAGPAYLGSYSFQYVPYIFHPPLQG